MRLLLVLAAVLLLGIRPAAACVQKMTSTEAQSRARLEAEVVAADTALKYSQFQLAFDEATSLLQNEDIGAWRTDIARVAGLAALKLNRFDDAVRHLESAGGGDDVVARLEEARIRSTLAQGHRVNVKVLKASVRHLDQLRRVYKVPETDTLVALARGHEALGEAGKAADVWKALRVMLRDEASVRRLKAQRTKEVDRSPPFAARPVAPTSESALPTPCMRG